MPRKSAAQAPTDAVQAWLATRGWAAFDFQRAVWAAFAQGQSGLLHANTGSGKTYALWLGALAQLHRLHATTRAAPPCSVVWLTPMRALAADTVRALTEPMNALLPHATIGLRTGDTPAAERARQDRRLPTVLVTTPESLTLLLTRERCRDDLANVRWVVTDEWHELIGNKRGVQVQLALARLRTFSPNLCVWGLSATLGNSEEAMHTLCGPGAVLVRGNTQKRIAIDTLIPPEPGRYTWAGHLGAGMLQPVLLEIERSGTTLIFTNTRSQAEIWFQLLLDAAPHLAGDLALHHSSLDKSVRAYVEAGLKQGTLRAVVATSSLDLGVDFLPVERVLQIGSAKGVARLLQRAGRSGHAPGRESRATLVPTHTMELVEAAAVRRAAQAGRIEQRLSPDAPLDVLVQHIVTVALGGGFEADALYDELRGTHAYRSLTRQAFDWALAFCARGGDSLTAYPDYHRIGQDASGLWRVPQALVAKRHRMSIGTIVSDASIAVKWLNGNTIGHMEEGFIARLRQGDCFVFAGRLLEFVRLREMVAFVVKPTKKRGAVPIWGGGKLPLSTELADAVLDLLAQAHLGVFDEPELRAAQAMLARALVDRDLRQQRGPPCLHLSVCWSACAHGFGQSAGLAARARRAQHFFHERQRLWL
jgi:ATP-dependent helicase Lhr and Lhr-like helicase